MDELESGELSVTEETQPKPKNIPKRLKEPKVFYRGFKKAREHGLFSLAYQCSPEIVKAALAERFFNLIIKYKSKIAKIDGLA